MKKITWRYLTFLSGNGTVP